MEEADDARQLSIAQRKCIFSDEIKLDIYDEEYSFTGCMKVRLKRSLIHSINSSFIRAFGCRNVGWKNRCNCVIASHRSINPSVSQFHAVFSRSQNLLQHRCLTVRWISWNASSNLPKISQTWKLRQMWVELHEHRLRHWKIESNVSPQNEMKISANFNPINFDATEPPTHRIRWTLLWTSNTWLGPSSDINVKHCSAGWICSYLSAELPASFLDSAFYLASKLFTTSHCAHFACCTRIE